MSASSTIVNATNQIATSINSYLPLATSAVLSVEQTMASAQSQTKLTTALGLIMDAAKVGEAIPNPGVAAISSLVDLVESIVSSFNVAGLFSHKSSTNTPQITPTITPLTAAVPPVATATTGALAGIGTMMPLPATSTPTAAPVAHDTVLGSIGHGIKQVFTGQADLKI